MMIGYSLLEQSLCHTPKYIKKQKEALDGIVMIGLNSGSLAAVPRL
jgi:hypothetical protein